jgi:hypothetical protein
MRPGLVPGVNVDRVDIDCGMAQARKLGYTDTNELMVIEYALQRWQRGEEDGAEATIRSHRIDYTAWRVVLAYAVASAAAITELRWAPYKEFGIADPAAETTEPPAGPVLIRATGYRGHNTIVYWTPAPSPSAW